MSSEHSGLQQTITKLVQKEYVYLTGRGTTALYLTLKALDLASTHRVVVPNLLSHSVLLGIRYAGYNAQAVDISPETYNISQNINIDSPGILLRAHLFGYPAPPPQNTANADIVINDIAQSVGGECHGSPMGHSGLATILSFGHNKPVAAGHGGAIATDDEHLYKIVEKIGKSISSKPLFSGKTQQIYKNANYLVEDHFERNRLLHFNYYDVVSDICRDLLLHRFNKKFSKKIDNLLGTIQLTRERNFEIYQKLKDFFIRFGDVIKLPFYEEENLYNWYFFSFLFRDTSIRKVFIEKMRANGIHISTCYVPVDYWDNNIEILENLNSHFVAKRIVNFHIAPCHDNHYLQRLLQLAEQYFTGVKH